MRKAEYDPFAKNKRPPLGLRPRNIWLLDRMQEIQEAIVSYTEANRLLPEEWLTEYIWLLSVSSKGVCENSGLNVKAVEKGD